MIIFGHRGAKGYAPENTMSSFRKAFDLGIAALELDVQLSKDRQLIICHDYKIDRTSNGSGLVADYTLKELKQFDFGSWFDPKFAGEKIVTLVEFLEWFVATNMKVNIEIKNGPVIYTGIEKEVVYLIEQYNILDRVIVSSFYHPSVKKIKELQAGVKTAALFECRPLDPAHFSKETGAEFLHAYWQSVDRAWVRQAHELGVQVNTYTVNTMEEYEFVANAGVDGIFSDFPDRF